MNKCVFLDRDGVINKDYVDYVYTLEKWQTLPGVVEALQNLKAAGYHLVIITNQSGVAKGIYTKEDVYTCYHAFQKECGNLLDEMYYSPYHEKYTHSLTRKPGSLMLEKGIAKFKADISESWMIGDKDRDLIPARKLGMKTILVDKNKKSTEFDYLSTSLLHASEIILK